MKKISSLQTCISDYRNYFPLDWISSLDWSDGDASLNEGISRIKTYIESCFVNISKSVLSGQYIAKNITPALDEIITMTSGKEYLPIDDDKNKLLLYRRYEELDDDIYIIAKCYKYHVSLITNKIKSNSHNYILNAISTEGKRIHSNLFQILKEFVLDLCLKEHLLSYQNGDIKDLILKNNLIVDEIGKYSGDVKIVLEVINEKYSFILKKLVYFDDKSEYAIDFINKNIDDEVNKLIYLKDTNILFDSFHGSKGYDISVVQQWQEKCIRKEARIREMVSLMRFYCKQNGTIEQIDNLLNEFNQFYNKTYAKSIDREFDKYALNTIKNYMYNCRLSYLICNEERLSIELFKLEMGKIEVVQSETLIFNFYPYQKGVEFLLKYIQNNIQNDSALNDKGVKADIVLVQKYIKKFEESIRWCEERRFYPFQLTYNDCITKHTEFGIVLFFPSSFCRPIKYDNLKDELMIFKSDVRFISNELQLAKERTQIYKLKSDIEKTKRGLIEILGIFTAVITFLISCVSIFQGNVNSISIGDKIQYAGILGITLLLFVCSIYVLIIPKEESFAAYFKNIKFWFFIVGAIIYAFILMKMV